MLREVAIVLAGMCALAGLLHSRQAVAQACTSTADDRARQVGSARCVPLLPPRVDHVPTVATLLHWGISAVDVVQVMGAPLWAADDKFATVARRLEHQEALDERIETWTKTLGKYVVTEKCQGAGVRAMAVQSAEDRVEHDPQLHQREMYLESEHPALGRHKVQNAPFKLSETPAANHLPSPMIGEHTREIVEGLLGLPHEELQAGFADGTFWPTQRPRFGYQEEMLR